MSGYIYRIAQADADTLRDTVATVVAFPCWSFGGAAAWDLAPEKGPKNLRPIGTMAGPDDLVVTGDFGHAFGARAEVRWKRRGPAHYDLLIFSDSPSSLAGAQPFGPEGGRWATSAPERPHDRRIIQTDASRYAPIAYLTYHAPNGAAQFLSYRQEVER